MSYQFLDAYGSVLTADSTVVGGAHQPIVKVASLIGAVSASITGTVPVTQSGAWTTSVVGGVSVLGGNVGVTQLGSWTTSVVGGVSVLGGSVGVTQQGAWTTSVVGGVSVLGGTVGATQVGAWSASMVGVVQIASFLGTYAEDTAHTTGDSGQFHLNVRNDNVASLVSANLEYVGTSTDSAGRILFKPYAAEEARVEGYNSVVSTSVTTLVAAAGAGLRNYITDVWVANTGASATLVTFRSQGGASVLGYTIAPAGGGSNLIGLNTPIRTGVNETFDFQPTTATSVLFATVKGYKAP